jgi:hypothetical protein
MERGPNGRMRLAPRVSIVAPGSAPPRECASVDFGPGAEVLPAGSARDYAPYSLCGQTNSGARGERRECRSARARQPRLLAQERDRRSSSVASARRSPATRCWHQRSPARPDHAGLGGRVDPAQRRRHRRPGVPPGRSHAAGHPPTTSCSPCRSPSRARRSTTPRRASTNGKRRASPSCGDELQAPRPVPRLTGTAWA